MNWFDKEHAIIGLPYQTHFWHTASQSDEFTARESNICPAQNHHLHYQLVEQRLKLMHKKPLLFPCRSFLVAF